MEDVKINQNQLILPARVTFAFRSTHCYQCEQTNGFGVKGPLSYFVKKQ